MRLTRRNLQLTLLLLLFVGADLLFQRDSGLPVTKGSALLAGIELGDIVSLTIEQTGTGAEEESLESSTHLLRGPAGWTVEERSGFPAHGGAVEELLRRLRAVGGADVVAAEPGSVERFGVGEGALHVVLSGEGSRVLADLRIGRPEETAAGSYLRAAEGARVFRAAAISVPRADPLAWIDSRLLDLDPPRVHVLRIQTTDGPERTLVRGENGLWSLAGSSRNLAPSLVDPLLLISSALYLEDVLAGPREGLGFAPPILTLRFELEDGGLRSLELGDEVAGRRAVFDPSWSGPWTGLLGRRTSENLLGAARRLFDAGGD